jgi:glycosyltransferase involved in cell wall biosynthesis
MKSLCHVFFDEYPKDSRIRRYTNTLRQNNYNICIICIGTNESFHEVLSNNVHIYRLRLQKKRSTILRRLTEYFLFEIFSFFMTSYVFFRHNIRIFHVHTLPDFLVFSCIIPKIFGARIILDFHELFAEFMMQHNASLTWHSLIVKILLFQEKLSIYFADTIITFHEPAKNIIMSRTKSNKKFTVIMNGIDESELPEIQKINDRGVKVIYNGTINFNLNLGLVIDAFVILRKKYIDVFDKIEFALYGDGPDLERLMDQAKENNLENIRYYGRLPFAEMVNEIAKATLCILPPQKDIYSELFYSLKLLEMIYFRIPVIATRLKTYEYYYPENCIYYFDSNNVHQLVEKIVFVVNNPDDVKVKTKNAFNEYQKYSWKIMSNRYKDVLNSFS